MDLAAVMDQIGDRLDTIAGLRVFRYPVAKITPPAAVVSYPDKIELNQTYARGMTKMTLPLVLVVGKVSDRSARNQLGAYCNDMGARSVVQILQSGTYAAFHEVVVQSIEFDVTTIAAVDYLAALFTLDIGGSGTS